MLEEELEENEIDYETELALAGDQQASDESPGEEDTRPPISCELSAKELKERLSFSKLLKLHGKDLVPGGSFKKCCCPFCRDKDSKFYIRDGDLKGFCYTCKRGGDIFDYIQHREKIGFRGAKEKLVRISKDILRDDNNGEGAI